MRQLRNGHYRPAVTSYLVLLILAIRAVDVMSRLESVRAAHRRAARPSAALASAPPQHADHTDGRRSSLFVKFQ